MGKWKSVTINYIPFVEEHHHVLLLTKILNSLAFHFWCGVISQRFPSFQTLHKNVGYIPHLITQKLQNIFFISKK